MIKKLIITSSFITFSAVVNADSYFNATIGQSNYERQGYKDNSHAVSVGDKLNDYVGMEVSYLNLGGVEFDGNREFSTDGFNIAAVGFLPISDSFELFAKLGVFKWDTLYHYGNGETEKRGSKDISVGIGASMKLNNQLRTILEYQRFQLDSISAYNASFGVSLTF